MTKSLQEKFSVLEPCLRKNISKNSSTKNMTSSKSNFMDHITIGLLVRVAVNQIAFFLLFKETIMKINYLTSIPRMFPPKTQVYIMISTILLTSQSRTLGR